MSTERVLYIVRHAKSSWEYEDISDLDRHLKIRGIRDAHDMARRVKIERKQPELLITSPAMRAMHTATIFTRVFEYNFSKLKIDQRLYGTGVSVIKEIVAEQAPEVYSLMIFGHNPDFSELAGIFSGNSIIEIPTCGLLRVTFKASGWEEISPDCVIDTYYDYPKKE